MVCRRFGLNLFYFVASLGLFAQSTDLSVAFELSLEQNAEWQALQAGVVSQKLDSVASRKLDPTMTLQVTPGIEGYTTGTLVPPEFPLATNLRLDWPLWNAADAARRDVERANERVGVERLKEAKSDLKADFLTAMARIAAAREIAAIRKETESSFGELKVAADRRVQLGAGNTKDSQRAAIASLQAHTSSLQAERQVEALWSAWAPEVRLPLESSEGGAWSAAWASTLETLGVIADLSGAVFPAVVTRASLAARLAALDAELTLAKDSWGATLSAFANLDGSVKLATDLTWTWRATCQAGVVLTLPVLAPAKTNTAMAPVRQKQEAQRRQLEFELAQQEREVSTRSKVWQSSLTQLEQRRATFLVAQQYADALRTELSSGTSSLETVLGGLQLKFRAQEDEANARWEAVAAALAYLKASGGVR